MQLKDLTLVEYYRISFASRMLTPGNVLYDAGVLQMLYSLIKHKIIFPLLEIIFKQVLH